jgi:ureidoacrylate peracid hydrolase
MMQVLEAARKTGIRVFYAMHRRYRPGDYETWKYIAPIQKAAWWRKSFEYGTWGGEIRAGFEPQAGDVVAAEHWCSSGFANTDLDLQLKKHGIHKVIVTGMIAHTCAEATVRYAAELGYEVTVVKDATASYSDEHMHAALEVNIPNYASAIVATDEIVGNLAALAARKSLPGWLAGEMRSDVWLAVGQQRWGVVAVHLLASRDVSYFPSGSAGQIYANAVSGPRVHESP